MHRILENCVGSYSLNEHSVPEPHGRGDTWGTMAVEKGGPWLGTDPHLENQKPKPPKPNHQPKPEAKFRGLPKIWGWEFESGRFKK